jgi:hypothetical protein
MQNCEVASHVKPLGQAPFMHGPLVVTELLMQVGVADVVKQVNPT